MDGQTQTVVGDLSPEQRALMPIVAERWVRYGLSTEPADRPAAEDAVRLAYRRGGLEPPRRILWAGSPLSLVLLDAVLNCVMLYLESGSFRRPKGFSTADVDTVREAVSPTQPAEGDVRPGVYEDGWGILLGELYPPSGNLEREFYRAIGMLVRVGVLSAGGRNPAALDAMMNMLGWWRSLPDDPIVTLIADAITRKSALQQAARSALGSAVNSQWESPWLAFYDFFREACQLAACDQLDGLFALHKTSGWWLARRGMAILSERPCILAQDEEHRLHSATGPAVAYPDGWKLYIHHSVRVWRPIIEAPETLTVQDITEERNAEVRRVMLEGFTAARYIQETNAKLLSEEEVGCLAPCFHPAEQHVARLWCAPVPDDEPIYMVEVVNSTAEPDGTWNRYWLRVHPQVRPILKVNPPSYGKPQKATARNAVASTFGLTGQAYQLWAQS